MTMANRRPKQSERVIRYIQDFGSITQRDALNDIGVFRLASRISELKKDGWPISSKMEPVKNRYGETCHIKRYFLNDDEVKCNDEA